MTKLVSVLGEGTLDKIRYFRLKIIEEIENNKN